MDFDINELMQNPMFLAGMNLLSSHRGESVGGAILSGYAGANQLKSQQQAQQLGALKLAQAKAQADFNPNDYMQTAPSPVGTSSALTNAPLTPAMPATLGGPAGGAMPQGVPPEQMPIPQPTPGTPTGRVDMPGLLQGGLAAGMSPSEVQGIAGIMDPVTAARQALMSKLTEVGPGGQVWNGLGTKVAENTSAPVSDPASVIARTQAAAQQARAAGNTALADQLDASVQKQSGVFEQQMRQQQMDATAAQREIANGQRQDSIDMRKTNQGLVQAQREQNNEFQVQRQATTLGNQLEKTKIPELQQALDQVQGIMDKYPKGDLPGFGVVQGSLPMWALSQDGQQLRQAFATVNNTILRSRAGTAQTNSEMDKVKQEMGNGPGLTEDRVRQGIAQIRNLLEAQKKNFVASTDPDVLKTYEENGGMPLSYLNPNSAAPKVAASVSIDKATPDDIAAAIARKKAGKK